MKVAAYAYFWPTYATGAGAFATYMIFTNLTLYAFCICLYYLVPSPIMEDFVRRIIAFIRELFAGGITKIERNIRKTFEIKPLYPVPKKSINVWHPHGLLAMTPGIHNAYRITSPAYTPTKFAVANIFHLFPFVRDWMKITHAISADYPVIKKTLADESVSIVLGGAKEMHLSSGKNLKLVIKERTGIFRLALETGTPLVPILTYGESELFPTLDNPIYACLREFVYDMWKIPAPLPTITSVQNWLALWDGPLPQITSYTGKPVYVKKIENPTSTHIEKLRRIYIRRVQDLFDMTNNGEYTLEIT
jgi:2-acylglycerol O-acyltransferase 2